MMHRQEGRQKGHAVKWSVHQSDAARRRAAQVIKDGCATVIEASTNYTHTELHKPHLAHSRVASTRHLMCSLPTLHYSST